MVENRIFMIIASGFEFCAHSFFRTNSSEPKMLKYVVFSGIGGGEGGKFTGVNTLYSGLLKMELVRGAAGVESAQRCGASVAPRRPACARGAVPWVVLLR